MCSTPSDKEQMVLSNDSPFKFSCSDNLLCFNQCCQDVNIFLTPYDILRLRRSLRISSEEFLAKYTLQFLTKMSQVPVIMLAMDPKTLRCQLVTDAGCSVYENRPWACRMYPLDPGEKEGTYKPIVGKDRCFGFLESASRTVEEWMEVQGLKPYREMDRLFQEARSRGYLAAPSDERFGRLLCLAYNLDSFSELLGDARFRELVQIDDDEVDYVREDDEELLKRVYRYIGSQMRESQ